MEQGYLAQVQALIDQKWKENPEEMKRVMAEIKAKEKQKSKKAETPKGVSFDPQLTQELIEEWKKPPNKVDMSKIQDLIERGADVNAKDNRGWTSLHMASWNNHIEIAEFLLDAGADVEAKSNKGETPLHLVDSDEMRELLKKYMK